MVLAYYCTRKHFKRLYMIYNVIRLYCNNIMYISLYMHIIAFYGSSKKWKRLLFCSWFLLTFSFWVSHNKKQVLFYTNTNTRHTIPGNEQKRLYMAILQLYCDIAPFPWNEKHTSVYYRFYGSDSVLLFRQSEKGNTKALFKTCKV